MDHYLSWLFDQHTVLIPSTYHQFISNLKGLAIRHPLVNLTELRNKLGVEAMQDKHAFKSMLQYFHSIGKIVWLLTTGYAFTDPTLAPREALAICSNSEENNTIGFDSDIFHLKRFSTSISRVGEFLVMYVIVSTEMEFCTLEG